MALRFLRGSPLRGGVRGGRVVWVLFVSGFLAAPGTHVCVCGVCGTGLLFENYIVDASIFYKKQFPRIYEPGSVLLFLGCAFRGAALGMVVWFSWFSRKNSVLLIFCGQVFKSTRWMPWH